MTESTDYFRENVRKILARRRQSMRDLAERIGTQRPNISRILSGKEGITLDRADRIAEELGVSLSKLIAPPR